MISANITVTTRLSSGGNKHLLLSAVGVDGLPIGHRRGVDLFHEVGMPATFNAKLGVRAD